MSHPRNLERDLEHTIPPEGGPDSRWLFAAMTRLSLEAVAPEPDRRVLDLACGMGQDTRALARMRRGGLGADAVLDPGLTAGLEPSNRMIRFGQGMARAEARAGDRAARIAWVRGFGEALPFRSASFDAVLCKGAMDHFRSPPQAMVEIARVLRPGGRVVLALANYDSLSCRLGRWRDRRRHRDANGARDAHPYYESPPDHLARFGYRDVLALVTSPLRLERVRGISLLWLFPPWSRIVEAAPRPLAALLLALAFAVGRALPSLADVTLVRAVRD